ncbi:hypothetical protein [Pseudomonas mediterranea]|uniref:hypothetical protein n=1 Tax=Pseudomonas mediterranea TaxID=183795 RepID=UPI00223495FE|nr:hypothetical protein [Pseudomonas mediterranea]UZD99957.1 hypothetical protein LOY71_20900 [Pseudomonas mediterranea]
MDFDDVEKDEPSKDIVNNLIEIRLPDHGYVPATFDVSGINGIPGAYPVTVWRAHQIDQLGSGPVKENGTWAVRVTMPSGVDSMEIYATQPNNRNPDNYRRVHRFLTTLTKPASNTIVRANEVVFGGTRFPDTRIWVYEGNLALAYLGDVTPERTWEVRPTEPLSSGVHSVKAQYKVGDLTGTSVTPEVSFTVLSQLAINPPSVAQEMRFNLTGTKGMSGATVQVKIDFAETVVGTTTAEANGNWSAALQMPEAGPTSLVAEQVYQGVPSQRSDVRAIKIKPPKPTNIQVSYPSSGTVKFAGAGYGGARLEILSGDAIQVHTVVTSGGGWAVDWPDQPPSAARQMNARQGVSDGAGDWIYSDRSDNFTVTVPVPVPTLTATVGADRKPVFSGTGHSWTGQPAARIEVRRVGESTPAVPTVEVVNNRWSSAATEAWSPGSYTVEARQLFNGIPSAPTGTRIFAIPAPIPTVELRQDGLTPHFFGICLAGAAVQVRFDGDPDSPYDAQVSGTTWSFTRAEPFVPGPHTARVTQSFGGQTSDEVVQSFEVVGVRPIITSPVNDEEVDHNPIIQGTGGIPGALMRVFDFLSKILLGEAEVTGNEWSVPITEDLAFDDHKVFAVQQYDDFPSEASEPASFKVILFPPTIDHPQPGDAIARVSVIDGYARKVSGLDTATVELWLDGADEPLATVRARGNDGYWFYDAHLPVGTYTLRAKQFFKDKDSDFSPDHAFTAVPATPVIESPALQQHLGATVTISGHGYTGDWVEVAWSDAPDTVLGRTQVLANRTWSIPLAIERPAGPHSLIVQQECDGYSSGWSAAHGVLLLSGAPTFTTPQAGQWFGGTAFFAGTGESGKSVEVSHWFDARQVIAADLAVADGTWMGSPGEPLLPGPHWVKARQAGSDWGASPRFDLAQEL